MPDDSVGSRKARRPTGRLDTDLELRLSSVSVRYAVVRAIVEAHFPDTVAPDALLASGLDHDLVLHSGLITRAKLAQRQLSRRWVTEILSMQAYGSREASSATGCTPCSRA